MKSYFFILTMNILCWNQLINTSHGLEDLNDLEKFYNYDYFDYNPRRSFSYDEYSYYSKLNDYLNYNYYDKYGYSNDYNIQSFNNDFDKNYIKEDEILGLTLKSEGQLLSIIKEIGKIMQNAQNYNSDQDAYPILQRKKRGIKRLSKSRRRSSSSSRGSSRIRKSKILDNKKNTESSSPSSESLPVDKSSYPKGNYGQLNPETGSNPPSGFPKLSTPTLQSTPVDKSSYPKASYPPADGGASSARYPSGGYQNQPSPGYPQQPAPGYPSSFGYPHQPSPGYSINPSPGYPSQQSSGYPQQPSHGYPIRPSPGNPQQPVPGYPGHTISGHPNQPSFENPLHPSYEYTSRGKPSLGIPTISGTYSGTGYPKKSRKEEILSKVKQAFTGYAMHKMHKKSKSRARFMTPGMGTGMDGMHGFHGGGTMPGMGSKKVGKNILGTIIKLQIAKYALKFGMKAAKAYFEHKLGRPIGERMIDKFISRYHRQRTKIYYRQNRRFYKNMKNFKKENITLGEDCIRDCSSGDRLTCFFSFHVHLYQYLSRACYNCPSKKEDCGRPECIVGSGRQKLVTVVNRQLPGPTIQVCKGDKILLEVHNELPNSGLTIHFRGQTYSEEPYMDGTKGVTSAVIASGEIFAYRFKADVSGTHFWHANTGLMRSDGVYGAFIVKEMNDPLQQQFDSDIVNQTIIVSEDLVKRGEEQLINLYHKKGKVEVYSLLINGRGFKQDESPSQSYSKAIYSHIKILSGKRNRLRLISAVSSNCPVSFRLQGKSFTVISIDGCSVNSRESPTLLISPGERMDVIVKDVEPGLYWMEVQGFLDCSNQKQFAIIDSKEKIDWSIFSSNDTKSGSEENFLPTENPFTVFHDMEELTESATFCNNTNILCSRNLSSLLPLPDDLMTPNVSLYLSLTSRMIHNEHYYSLIHYDIASLPVEEQSLTHQINNLTLRVANEPLFKNDHPLKFGVCSSAGVLRKHCVQNFCECLHLLQLPVNKTTEIIFINEGEWNSAQPQTMYLHGYNFWVLSQSKEFLPSNETLDNSTSPYLDRLRVIIRDAEELLIKNTKTAVRMNTITIPEGGYAVIRFKTSNPGFWLLESSSVFRSTTGMAMVIMVGEKKDFSKKVSQMLRTNTI